MLVGTQQPRYDWRELRRWNISESRLPPGSVIEFRNEDIEKLQRRVAEELGFELIDHRLELYGVPKGRKPQS